MKWLGIIVGVMALGIIAAWWHRPSNESAGRDEAPRKREMPDRRRMADEARSGTTKEVPGKTGGAPADMERRLQLARLKKAWLALGPGDHDEEARIALQKDSIEALMCSFEMHELSVFLREHEIRLGYPGGSLMRAAI